MQEVVNHRRGAVGVFCIAICWLLAGRAGAQQTISWTGGGSDNNWSNTNNWDLFVVPGAADTVVFGNDAPDEAQTVHLDVPGYVFRIDNNAGGNRRYTLTGESITIERVASDTLYMYSGAQGITFSNAQVNVYTGIGFRNLSANWMTFAAPIVATPSSNTDFRDGRYALLAANDWGARQLRMRAATFWIGHEDALNNASLLGIYFRNTTRYHLASDLTPNNHFAAWDSGAVLRLNIVGSGAADRMLTLTRLDHLSGAEDGRVVFDENEAGSTGTLTLRLTGNSLNPLPVETRSDSIVQFDASGTVTLGSTASGAHGVISGEGQVLKTNTGTLEVQTVNTYTGGTIIRGGTLRLASNAVLEANGQLPAAGAVALAAGATLDLNGIDQEIGALNDDNGGGTVQLNGATLTVNAAQGAAFGGVFEGAGALVKAGPATWALTAGYTNAAGRTLRIEDGLLEVNGTLSVEDGVFELAGGRITIGNLAARETAWNVTLALDNVGQTLVTVTEADIVGGTLNLALADGYTPELGQLFVLLNAGDTIAGASPAGIFQYQDGEVFALGGGTQFRIDFVNGSEQVQLTVIPEPGSLLLLLAGVAGALRFRRRRG